MRFFSAVSIGLLGLVGCQTVVKDDVKGDKDIVSYHSRLTTEILPASFVVARGDSRISIDEVIAEAANFNKDDVIAQEISHYVIMRGRLIGDAILLIKGHSEICSVHIGTCPLHMDSDCDDEFQQAVDSCFAHNKVRKIMCESVVHLASYEHSYAKFLSSLLQKVDYVTIDLVGPVNRKNVFFNPSATKYWKVHHYPYTGVDIREKMYNSVGAMREAEGL